MLGTGLVSVVRLFVWLLPFLAAPAYVASQSNGYVVGAQDVLTISLWDQAELSGKFTVEVDGTFTFPLIGRVKAGGLTLRELEMELKKRLADGYFRNPQLSVAVEQYRSQRIFVVGEVRQPGTYPLSGEMTLIEVLARVGPTTGDASGEALIVRPPTGQLVSGPMLPSQAEASEIIHIDIKGLQSGRLSQNLVLRDGDTLFVPRAQVVYILGQVKSPGAYSVQKDTTVLQVLSLAGGLTDRGSADRIRAVRMIDGKKKEFKVKLNDLLQAGDTIIVKERFF